MKKKSRFLAILLSALLTVSLLPSAFAEEEAFDYSAYEKGVTVEKDSASPTGYTATFVYKELPSYTAPGGAALGKLAKVELYSDCLMLFQYEEQASGVGIDKANAHRPEEFKAGMYPAGGNGDTTCYVEMTSLGDGLWGCRVPLSSGAFVYNFRVTDEAGTSLSRLDDPSNPTLTNTATKIHSLSSMVYVPYDAAKQGTGTWADRSAELPQGERTKRGTVETVSYTGADNTQHGLAVYLPAGYDKNRSEPYKVLYLSHGTSGDIYGNELRWMHEGAVANIMDNLIAARKAEPFVVVTMNNQQYSQGEGHSGPNWKYSDIETDQIDHIMPYVEEHYNVSKTAEGRAYAGLSMGGSTTSNMLMYHPDLFSYYGIWSYANVEGVQGETEQKTLSGLTSKPNIMLAAGSWDFGLSPVKEFGAALEKLGLKYTFLEVPAAHDWECWQLTYANAVENFFWKNSTSAPEPKPEPAPGLSFQDVAEGSPYYDAVRYCVEKGLMTSSGSDSLFAPGAPVTRSALVSVLYGMEGSPAAGGSSFSDVASKAEYASAVKWAQASGLVSGYGDGRFGPDDFVTWEQMLSILYRYADSKGCDVSGQSSVSAAVSDYAKPAAQWAAANHMLPSEFTASRAVVRGQLAVILQQFCETVVK